MILRLEGAGWTWPSGGGVGPLDLEVRPGERVLLSGPSGGGKSTLLRLAAGLLQRHGLGEARGRVEVDGADPAALAPAERAARVALVAQEPGDQLVAGTVADELAFGPEAARWPGDRVERRVRALLAEVGLAVSLDRDPATLSGGQQQRLVVGAALAPGARLLLLDEPLAQLDPDGAAALLAGLERLSAGGVAVVCVEHRLGACWSFAERVVLVDGGRVVLDRPRDAVEPAALAALGLQVPGRPEPAPALPEPDLVVALDAPDVHHAYEGREVLGGIDVRLRRGERVALVGPNGAGKSTLLRCLSERPGVLWVPQDPDLTLFCATVREEIGYGPAEAGLPQAAVRARVEEAARALRVAELLERPPQALSRGQRLRVAVAAALACRPDVLLLDEPTAGQDRDAVEGMMQALVEGFDGAVLFATHDHELARRWAHRTIRLPAQPPAPVVEVPERRGLDPRVRLALLLAVGVFSLLLDRPAALALLTAATLVPWAFLDVSPTWRRRAALLAAAVIWSTVLSQGLFYAAVPRVPLVQVGPVVLWREGVVHGLVQSLRLVAMGAAGLALAASTPPDRLFAGLVGLRVPWAVAFLAVTALRFVPVAGRELWTVRRARARRGRPLLRRGPLAWLRLEMVLLRPVVARSLRRARVLAESLDVRGFDPAVPRRPRRPLRLERGDVALLAGIGAALGALIVLEAAYALYLAEVVYRPELRPVYGWVRAWL